jgi:hypothetical protein
LNSTQPDLSALTITPLVGDEPFRHKGISLTADVASFWRWAYSNLAANNLRGHLAEFFVASALNKTRQPRIEWDNCDLRTQSGIRVEVKSAAYLQAWKQIRHSTITFGIAPSCAYDSKIKTRTKIPARNSDVFVFCLLSHKDKKTLDPTNLDQWEFYVLRTAVLDEKLGGQKTLTLSGLLRLGPLKCEFGEIAHSVEALIGESTISNISLQADASPQSGSRP